METENGSDRSNNICVSIGLQNVMDRYGTDQKAIRYNGSGQWKHSIKNTIACSHVHKHDSSKPKSSR